MNDWQWADELMGSSAASEDAVRTADERVPADYDTAKALGLVNEKISREEFYQCREFLASVAKRGLAISGSY